MANIAIAQDLRPPTLARRVPVVLDAIIKAAAASAGTPADFSIRFPRDSELCTEQARWTTGLTDDDMRYIAFEGVVGAGDGCLVPLTGMRGDPTFDRQAHRSRKRESRS